MHSSRRPDLMAGQVPVDALSEDMAKLGLEKAAVEKLLAFLQVESGWDEPTPEEGIEE